MTKADNALLQITGPAGTLPVSFHDKLAQQLAMLFECHCLGKSVKEVTTKYNYSRQRYFQIQKKYLEHGTESLIPKKSGPKSNYVRVEDVNAQIIRHKFLDPDASADVIAQKLCQTNIPISKRSVQRTIADYGLQKKTLCITTKTRDKREG